MWSILMLLQLSTLQFHCLHHDEDVDAKFHVLSRMQLLVLL